MEKKTVLNSCRASSRKSYRAPMLSYYGDVNHVTRGSGGPNTDGGGGMTKV
jgi:hypothetical protein